MFAPPRNGSGQQYRITVWQIKRNEPKEILSKVYSFLSPFQAVLEHMEALSPNPLPRKVYEKGQHGGYKHSTWSLEESGIAKFTQI